jgi:hypothetical protein
MTFEIKWPWGGTTAQKQPGITQAPPAGGNNNASGGGAAGDGNQNQNNGGGGNPNANGGGNNDGDFTSLWDDPVVDDKGKNNQQNGNNAPAGGGGNDDPDGTKRAAILDNYIKGRVQPRQFTPEQLEQIRTGDQTPLLEAMSAQAQDLYRNVLGDMVKMQEQTISKAVDKALSQGKTYIDTNAALSVLHAQMPASLDKDVRPIMETVFGRFMAKNANNVEKSVELTKKFAETMGKKFGGGGTGGGGSRGIGRGQFDRGGAGGGDDSDLIDFVSVLTGEDEKAA